MKELCSVEFKVLERIYNKQYNNGVHAKTHCYSYQEIREEQTPVICQEFI